MQKQIIPDIVNTQSIITLETTASVHDAVQNMSTHNVSAVTIVDDQNKLVGIVSERDMTHRVLACGLSPQATNVCEIMTKDVETLKPKDSALDAIELMLSRNIRHLPVVDENDNVLAMISIRDLMRRTRDDLDVEIAGDLKIAFAPTSV
ncbi:MAG: CBS domain-containing protein [Rhodospirillaceae bacterium]|nr:MAG: CBS domain-containing protein [Rhodospirillaceae bacterium]